LAAIPSTELGLARSRKAADNLPARRASRFGGHIEEGSADVALELGTCPPDQALDTQRLFGKEAYVADAREQSGRARPMQEQRRPESQSAMTGRLGKIGRFSSLRRGVIEQGGERRDRPLVAGSSEAQLEHHSER
jgi:hypothetical protein